MQRLWQYVRWGLHWLWMGEWPRCDVDGHRITSGPSGPLAGGGTSGFCSRSWATWNSMPRSSASP
eukprot:8976741-Alexandrium_andersonii.AAC.1